MAGKYASQGTNVARAFAVVHENGHVIGDVNHANIFVSEQATVMLIDCDSFQITTNGRRYLCEVGVSTHQPPEFQGISLRNEIRTPNHDNFGLAVIIFQMIFVGRHPFSGTYLGPGEMSLEKAIKEFRFAYGASAATKMMKPPLSVGEKWLHEAGEREFLSKMKLLEKAREEYQGLSSLRQTKLNHLKADQRKRQLTKFLDKYRLEDTAISGIGPSRKATLQSFGIETAADITESAIFAVPGFGPSLTAKLTYWRQSLEANFVFDPSRGMEPADVASLEKEISFLKVNLEKTLLSGVSQLKQINNKVTVQRKALK